MAYIRKYSVFISSTYEDLVDERQALLGVALENDYIPVGMEQFHAYPASQWQVITKMIDECDAYLLVIGGRYGSMEEGSGISYTEKEYNYAKSKGIPVLALIRTPKNITQDKMDTGDDQFIKQKKLEEFRTRVEKDENTVSFFGTLSDLKYEAANALRNAVSFCGDSAGWVRYSDMQSIVNEKIGEQNAISIQLREQQDSRMKNVENAIATLMEEFKNVKNNQLTWQEIQPVTHDDIANMFSVKDE